MGVFTESTHHYTNSDMEASMEIPNGRSQNDNGESLDMTALLYTMGSAAV